MPKAIDPERQRLMEQVLEYWYTVDFLNQGALQTEMTRRDKDNYAFTMGHPKQFGSLYRHEFLEPGENILDKVKALENVITAKREKEDEGKEVRRTISPCCHGKITVYVGSLSRAFLSGKIAQLLQCEPPSNPSADRLAMASLQLSDEGKYIYGSFSLSPIVWAVRRIMHRQENMTMYEVLDPGKFKEAHTAYAPTDSKDPLAQQKPFTSYEEIHQLAEKLLNDTVLPICSAADESESLADIHYSFSIYRNQEERAKRETDDYYGLSMSFYAADLAGFKNAVTSERWMDNPMWNMLIDYICAPYDAAHGKERIREDLSIVGLRSSEAARDVQSRLRDALSIDKTPWGKWPSKHQPFLMQQAAINLAINSNDPIFAVNGPPGTGKTTLLKEIVAENVVEKALIMSAYETPDSMFVSNELPIGASKHYYYSFCPQAYDIRKYAIVVASSNNAAVENISKQLPLCEPMEKNLHNTGNTLLEKIHRMFSLQHAKEEIVYRKNFEKEGQPNETVKLPDIYFSSYATELLRDKCWGLVSVPLGKRSNIVTFHKKVLNQLYWDFFRQSNFCKSRLAQYQTARKQFLEQFETVKQLRGELRQQIARAQKSRSSSFGNGEDKFICLNDKLFAELAADDPETRKTAQMTCPRISARYDREREKLFHDALTLTKEFVLASDCCRSNFSMLGMAWNLEKQSIFSSLKPAEKDAALKKCMTSLIQTLQLLVPVISTTFASSGRFFGYVNKLDALGTIIVDEAGQATPQMALRLFSKASRAIIVGDPNQIDPVVSDELAFLQSTLDQEIGEVYSDRTISVQKIADYLSRYGGLQADALGVNGEKWVGIPLYVHSRCVEPMFSISNHLSYGDAMLRITSEPSADLQKTFCQRASQWINISGEEEKKKNHFVRKQGERVLELLDKAFAQNALKTDAESREAGPDLFIISPFHTTAEGMRQLLTNSLNGDYPALAANRNIVENWLIDEQNPHIGTVHTFQGREANEVILLLGCDEGSQKSAKWVNRNIVNVAVSRAKYRLYVIGDAKVWSCCDPVMEMKYDLDTYAFEKLSSYASSANQDYDFDIPELPSFEMFDIEEVEGDLTLESDYTMNVESGLASLQKVMPQLNGNFTPEQLSYFGLTSMNEFLTRFSPEVQALLKTGMWNYLWIKPQQSNLPAFYDASSIAVCFCKAFEMSLKQNFFHGLQLLVPDTPIRGKKLSEIDADSTMIGEYSTIISLRQNDLGLLMKYAGYPEYDADWWGALLDKLRACKDCRNDCCHPGKPYTWEQLECLLRLLFRDSTAIDLPGSKLIHGLLLEDRFCGAVKSKFAEKTDTEKILTSLQPGNTVKVQVSSAPKEYLTRFCEVFSRIRKCTIDGTTLTQSTVEVCRRSGQVKRLNMLYCQACGRYYMNTSTLSVTTKLSDYNLKAISAKDW